MMDGLIWYWIGFIGGLAIVWVVYGVYHIVRMMGKK